MDSAIGTAARALSLGDPLRALKFVALRNDAFALALRGIAMAQLGELMHARALLRRAVKAFGPTASPARARCLLAQAEVALALRDLGGAAQGLTAAATLLESCRDRDNIAFARLLEIRRLTLLGDIDAAERILDTLVLEQAPARMVALASLAEADLAMKRTDADTAEMALQKARRAAFAARIPQIMAEVDKAQRRLVTPVARLKCAGKSSNVLLRDLKALGGSGEFVVDLCRREARRGEVVVSLVRRALLLELLVALADGAPGEVARDALIGRIFGVRRVNESHRVRLRVEVGRLRRLIGGLAGIEATAAGYALVPHGTSKVMLLVPPSDGEAIALLSLLQSGEAWGTSALAAAVGKSQRAVQRALLELESRGRVQAVGRGRAKRWVTSSQPEIATTLLLAAPGTLG